MNLEHAHKDNHNLAIYVVMKMMMMNFVCLRKHCLMNKKLKIWTKILKSSLRTMNVLMSCYWRNNTQENLRSLEHDYKDNHSQINFDVMKRKMSLRISLMILNCDLSYSCLTSQKVVVRKMMMMNYKINFQRN